MITENLSTLKIHKLTQAQYNRELEAGTIDENALYLTPDEAVSQIGSVTLQSIIDLSIVYRSVNFYRQESFFQIKGEVDITSFLGDNSINLKFSIDSLFTDAGFLSPSENTYKAMPIYMIDDSGNIKMSCVVVKYDINEQSLTVFNAPTLDNYSNVTLCLDMMYMVV